MNVWLCIPSKRPLAQANEVLAAWKERGYKIALMREVSDGCPSGADLCLPTWGYQGWARSVNVLISAVTVADRQAQWFVTGGDDYWPDPTKSAAEVAAECASYFTSGFGVMQPTGDRWGEKNGQATIDRIAGSPWLGREFCRRMYHGGGPLYSGYFHNFADEELQRVAQQLGVFWQRRDLNQEHRHWARPRGDWADCPDWARKINDPNQSDWDKSKALFAKRAAANFPGHEPLDAQ